MIPVIQPFHILVLALTGWLNRQQQAVIDLDVEYLVEVELTSEDTEHPIESALTMNAGSGWRAQQPGKQTIRLLFDKPHRISRIQLAFQEDELERTQEFELRWSQDGGASYREIVRQGSVKLTADLR